MHRRAVVKTKAILSGDVPALLVGRHVFAPDESQEGRQGASLQEPYREQARQRWAPAGAGVSLLLDKLKLDLPAQPPPKISPAAVTPASPL